MYSFVAANNNFMGCSTVYNVYDECNVFISQFVVGYSIENELYYITEYKGADMSLYSVGVQSSEELATILYDFSQIFEYMDYADIFSNMSVYSDHQDNVPKISKKLLYMYDSYGEISNEDGKWIVVAEDDYVEQLIYSEALEGSELFLEEENDEGELYINLQEDAFCCDGDEIEGFYAKIYWDKIEAMALANNI